MWKAILSMESGVLRGLGLAMLSLLGLILSFFGVDEAVFGERGQQVLDAVLLLITAGSVFYAAYKRANAPNPNLTLAADVKERELVATGKLPVEKATVGIAASMGKVGEVQGGYVRGFMLAILLACAAVVPLTLTGCELLQQAGVPECRDLNDCADIAYDSASEWVVTVRQMNDSGQLSNEDALNALDLLEGYVNGIALARKVGKVNDADGRARLEAARIGLVALIDYLESKRSGDEQ